MPKQRREYILRLLEQRGHLRSADLARELGVTEETIRTDFVALEKKQLLQRLHGGARYTLPQVGSASAGGADDMRLATQMARAAREHIHEGDRLFLEDSLYSRSLIALLGDLPCSIISNSLNLLPFLSPSAQVQELIVLGGKVDKATGLMGGDLALSQLAQLQPDKAFLSPPSISAKCLGYPSALQAELVSALVSLPCACYLMVSAQALGAQAAYTVQPYRCDKLIVEDVLPADWPDVPVQLIPVVEPVIVSYEGSY